MADLPELVESLQTQEVAYRGTAIGGVFGALLAMLLEGSRLWRRQSDRLNQRIDDVAQAQERDVAATHATEQVQDQQLAQLTDLVMGLFGGTAGAVSNRARTVIHVGAPLDPSVSPNGSALAPFLEIQHAINWAAAQPETFFRIQVAPGTYSAVTIPAGKQFYVECGLFPGTTVPKLTMTGTPGGGLPYIVKGLSVTTQVDFVGVDPSHQAILVFLETGQVPAVTNTGGIQCVLVGIGAPEPSGQLVSLTFGGAVNIGTGFMAVDRADVQQPVTCAAFAAVDSRLPAQINCSGANASIYEAEGPSAFPFPTVVNFTGPAGLLDLDSVSTIGFGLAGGQIVNGLPSRTPDGPQLLFCDSAFNAFDAAVPASAGRMQIASGTDSGWTYGVVYPAVGNNQLGLLWRSGQTIPAAPPGFGPYFRDPVTGAATLASPQFLWQRLGLSDGLAFFVDIDRNPRQSTGVLLASLVGDPSIIVGQWYNGEFLGYGQVSRSQADPAECHALVADRVLVLDRFKFRQWAPSAADETIELYIGPYNNPGAFVFSGVSFFVPAGDTWAEENVQTLSLAEGDAVLAYHSTPGYSPYFLELTARRTPV